MIKVIKPDYDGKKLFLMGPIKGAPDWQSEVVKKLEEMGAQYIIANPRIYSESDSIDLDSQIAWES